MADKPSTNAAAAQWQSEASMQDEPAPDIGPDNSLLILDDDASFRTRLARAMEKRGFAVVVAESVAEGLSACRANPPRSWHAQRHWRAVGVPRRAGPLTRGAGSVTP